MSDWFYVGVTYSLTWVVLAGYVAYLGRKTSRAHAALDVARGGNDDLGATP